MVQKWKKGDLKFFSPKFQNTLEDKQDLLAAFFFNIGPNWSFIKLKEQNIHFISGQNSMIFCYFLRNFIDFMTLKYPKSYFSIKKLISTSERHAEHPLAGQNTQHTVNSILYDLEQRHGR